MNKITIQPQSVAGSFELLSLLLDTINSTLNVQSHNSTPATISDTCDPSCWSFHHWWAMWSPMEGWWIPMMCRWWCAGESIVAESLVLISRDAIMLCVRSCTTQKINPGRSLYHSLGLANWLLAIASSHSIYIWTCKLIDDNNTVWRSLPYPYRKVPPNFWLRASSCRFVFPTRHTHFLLVSSLYLCGFRAGGLSVSVLSAS